MQTRKKSMSILYNGVEAWQQLFPYLEQFSYVDSVDESDQISLSVSDRDLNWVNSWMPKTGDLLLPSVTLENWNYEGERALLECGSFVVDDFRFSSPPLKGTINGVSAPVNSGFKETENSKIWKDATVQLIAGEIAGKYGMALVYDADSDIPVAKIEQSQQPDSDFLKKLCSKYGLGLKVYSNRLIVWDYRKYSKQPPIITLKPADVSKWSYNSSSQGTYTGAKVSYTVPGKKEMVEVLVGTEERLFRTSQKADNEEDARRIGESALLEANRKECTMQLTLPPRLFLVATKTVMLSEFGSMDGPYFIEKVSHSIGRKSYGMQLFLSRVAEPVKGLQLPAENEKRREDYVVKKGDTLMELAQKFYGDAYQYRKLYDANKEAIEADARRHGKGSSQNGYWIWPGLVISIP